MANNRTHRNETDSAKIPRTGHSLSHKFSFTAACGQLLPTFWDYAWAGDTYYIGTGFDLSRALPLLNPASIDITVSTDYFFVPMDLMDISFGSKYEGVRDVFSTAITEGGLNIELVRYSYSPDAYMSMRTRRGNSLFDSLGCSAFRLFDMLGFSPLDWTRPVINYNPERGENGELKPLTNSQRPSIRTFLPYPFLAYQCVYQYFYRDEEFETFDPAAFNIDYYNRSDTASDYLDLNVLPDTVIRNAKALGKWLQLRYANRRSDYFTDMSKSALITDDNLLRSVADFGRNQFGLHSWLSSNAYSPVSVDARTGENFNNNNNTGVGASFTNLDPSVDFEGDGSLSSILNTAGLRAMFAQEKMLRITQAAKKTYDDQILAHFGVKVPHDPKHQITHFGHDVMKYKVSEVVSTAQTKDGDVGAVLGEQAGRLYGASKGGRHKFTAPCHGIVIAVTHVAPDYNYLVPENRLNSYSSVGDFWRPEYDHLGRQPVFRREIQWNAYDHNAGEAVGIHAADVVGWQEMYSENKKRFNKVSWAFAAGTYFSYSLVTSPLHHLFKQKLMESWRSDTDFLNGIYLQRNKVSPHDTDGIFGASYNGIWQEKNCQEVQQAETVNDLAFFVGSQNMALYDFQYQGDEDVEGLRTSIDDWLEQTGLDFREHPEQIYATDPFVLHADITCNKVSKMSKNSLPKLDM